jgi:hypothetical protein
MTLPGACAALGRQPRASFDLDAVNEFLETGTFRGPVIDHVRSRGAVREVKQR